MKFTIKETNKITIRINNIVDRNCLIHTNRGNFFKIATGGSYYIYTQDFRCFGGFNPSRGLKNEIVIKELETFISTKLGQETKVLNVISMENLDINIKIKREVV